MGSILTKFIFYFLQLTNFSLPYYIYKRFFLIPVVDAIGTNLFLPKESELLPLFKAIRRSTKGIAIDVGANIGQTLLKLYSAEFKNIICFEPDPRCCNYLLKLGKLNGLIQKGRLNIICGSLSSQKNNLLEINTMIDRPAQSASADNEARDMTKYNYIYQSFSSTLDCYINANTRLEEVSLIKVDVEGLELEVLIGAENCIDTYKPFILFESLPVGPKNGKRYQYLKEKANNLYKYLVNHDYKIYLIGKNSNMVTINNLITHTSYRYMQFIAIHNKRYNSFMEKI